MSKVASPSGSEVDLIDLRFLPAWVKQEAAQYGDFPGEELLSQPEQRFRARRERGRREEGRPPRQRERRAHEQRDRRDHRRPPRVERPSRPQPQPAVAEPLPELEIRFLPHAAAFENVATQIKNGTAAYSLYALARLFLQKPERYDVHVTSKNEKPFFRLGDSAMIATDRAALESSAFRALKNDYYETHVTLNEPVKGNFTAVARERSTGTLLGPTNYHAYQPQLRRLYEQRFSRRMSFPDFQRQIEIVSDPALVTQWQEDARKVTTFTTRKEELPRTLSSEAEAERHFREKYLPGLVAETREAEIDGRTSRQLRDRGIARVIENAWAAEMASPSRMMQELAARFRDNGLHIFRHRKGMLFVSPLRPRGIDEAAVSDSVRAILEAVKTSPRIQRKDLAGKLIGADAAGDQAKLKLAADLRWLIREGHLLEFNDGSLDLPRMKTPEPAVASAVPSGPTAETASDSPVIPSEAEESRSETSS